VVLVCEFTDNSRIMQPKIQQRLLRGGTIARSWNYRQREHYWL